MPWLAIVIFLVGYQAIEAASMAGIIGGAGFGRHIVGIGSAIYGPTMRRSRSYSEKYRQRCCHHATVTTSAQAIIAMTILTASATHVIDVGLIAGMNGIRLRVYAEGLLAFGGEAMIRSVRSKGAANRASNAGGGASKLVRTRLRRLRRSSLLALATMAIGAVPALSAIAASVTLPGIRDNVSNTIARSTAPAGNAVNKVIGPASEVAPTIGETTAPVNDSAMFRANSALKDQVASDTSGVISNN